MSQWTQMGLGSAAAALVAWGAYRARALASSGAWAAVFIGGVIFGLGGWAWAGLLLAFFISSSALSHLFRRRKRTLGEKFAKGSRRDWGQVAANGGLAAALAVFHARQPEAQWAWVAFAGALAAVNADTWATEIGVLSPWKPRHILTGKPLPAGTSGGVSPLGLAAALGGAALLGGCAAWGPTGWPAALAITAGGFGGALLDSALGATVQAMFFCPHCQQETEHTPRHTCGTPTLWRRGWQWMNNDVVNALASLAGAVLAAGIWALAR